MAVVAAVPLCLCCRVGNVIESSRGAEDQRVAERRWTLLVYMNGDNELEPHAIESLNQLESVDLGAAGITVLVLLDRSPGYDTSNGDWTGTRLYEVAFDPGEENADVVSRRLASRELGLTTEGDEELDMGDPATLSRFLVFAQTSYPSEQIALILWGHGSGWRAAPVDVGAFRSAPPTVVSLPSTAELSRPSAYSPHPARTRAVSFDDASASDPLYTHELGEALSANPVDIIGFDCCSEAMIEVAYQIRASASYMVASEDVTSCDGWDYRELLSRLAQSEETPEAFLDSAIESFALCERDTAGATISAIDLRAVGGVMSALDSLSESLWRSIVDTPTQTELRRVLFEEVEDFYRTPGDLDLDLLDLAKVVEERVPDTGGTAEALANAVSAAVVDEWHHPQGNPRAHGLAVHYVPLSADGTAAVHDDAYFRNVPAEYPLEFVADSMWVPQYPSGPGLLYRLWYEVFP